MFLFVQFPAFWKIDFDLFCSKCSLFFFNPSVNLVKSKLDPENLGIILLGPFLLEFFPDQVGHMTVYLHLCAYVQGRIT